MMLRLTRGSKKAWTGFALLLALEVFNGGTRTGAMAEAAQSAWTIDSGPIDRTHYFGETVANGMLGLRSSADPFRVAQIVMNGAYEPLAPGGVDVIERTLNFLDLRVSIDGVRIENADQVSGFRQTLDMRRAVLTTTFDYGDKATIVTSLRALRQLPYTAMLEVRVTAKQPITLSAASALMSTFPHESAQPGSWHPALNDLELFSNKPDGKVLVTAASATGPTGKVKLGAAQVFRFDDSLKTPPRLSLDGSGQTFTEQMDAGSTLRFALIGSSISSAQTADPVNQAQRLAATAWIEGIDGLIEKHEQAWAGLWKSDIVIEGDDATQRAVHSMIYHLYSFIREDSRLSIGPMGLSRDIDGGYSGHIFWDAETWMYPSLLLLHPEMARSMLDYRYDRLAAAKQTAFANGYRGALFPWESAGSGGEDTPLCCIPIEIHITADIGIAAWQYYLVSEDREWLRDRGYPLMEATADFWTSRVTRHASGAHDDAGSYNIDHVEAADEYSGVVDDDAFTNGAARENLMDAIAAARVLGVKPNPDWQIVHDHIPILKFPDGTTREFATYHGQQTKQADPNMLAYPLHEVTSAESIRRDLDYYSPRIDPDGPAMTKSVLAILYERMGDPEKALELFHKGYELNERPPFGMLSETATSANPYFATGAGGLLQTMLFGFGGLDISERGIVQRPAKLPSGWTSLKLTGIGVEKRDYLIK